MHRVGTDPPSVRIGLPPIQVPTSASTDGGVGHLDRKGGMNNEAGVAHYRLRRNGLEWAWSVVDSRFFNLLRLLAFEQFGKVQAGERRRAAILNRLGNGRRVGLCCECVCGCFSDSRNARLDGVDRGAALPWRDALAAVGWPCRRGTITSSVVWLRCKSIRRKGAWSSDCVSLSSVGEGVGEVRRKAAVDRCSEMTQER